MSTTSEPKQHVYEVRCHACNVSFPPGTPTCFYCGKPLGRRRAGQAELELQAGGAEARSALSPRGLAWLFWALLALATALYRACAGG
jgi:hypothetical protein